MYDARNSLSEPVVQAARDQYTKLVTKTQIPVNVRGLTVLFMGCRCVNMIPTVAVPLPTLN